MAKDNLTKADDCIIDKDTGIIYVDINKLKDMKQRIRQEFNREISAYEQFISNDKLARTKISTLKLFLQELEQEGIL